MTVYDFVPNPEDDGAPVKPETGWRFHRAEEPAPTAWLIKNILPETGTALISGQWGTYKTTVALDLANSVMTGTPFADRHAVKRRGGVAYFALEGAGGLASRLSAIARAHGSTEALPFVHRSDCPALAAPDALAKLAAMVEDAASLIRDKFNLPTALVFVDTVVTAAGYAKSGDDNDAAVAQRVMSVLSGLSQRTGALVVGIDHFGKVTDTGTRGSSAKEGHADTVLALLADRELNGTVTNTKLAVRKQRDGLSGLELAFTPTTVQIGTDADGDPITRVVIDWTAPLAQPQNKDWSKSLQLLRRILMTALVDHGAEAQPFLDGPIVRACDLDIVRTEFCKQYPADGTAREKADTRRHAFTRAVKEAQAKNLIVTREVEGSQLIWLGKNEAGP